MQNLCQNNFVPPTTAGTISSAQLGILIALLFMPSSTIFVRAIFAFVAAMLGTIAFVGFIGAIKFKDTVMVALVGIMFSYVISGITSFLAFKFEIVQAMTSWLSGPFSIIIKGRYEILYLGLPVILASYILANYFNVISLGKNFSKNLGLSYTPMLFAGLCFVAMLTDCVVVVVVGTIPYIGLIVPNLVRIFIGDILNSHFLPRHFLGHYLC